VFGVTAASRNTRFQAARYGLTWAGLAPADRASFAWRLLSFDHLIGAGEQPIRHGEAERLRTRYRVSSYRSVSGSWVAK
jgi:hypothetical protein